MQRTAPTAHPPTRLPYLLILATPLLVVGGLLLGAWLSSAPASNQTYAAPNPPIEVTRLSVVTATATGTPTPTPRPTMIVVTATFTPSPAIVPCAQATDDQVCIRYPGTATPTPLPPLCAAITQAPYSTQICRKGDGQTSAKGETG